MPTPIVPQDQWETDFEGPLPGEPGVSSAFNTLIQRILNRTERLKNRVGSILGLPWDATPPDTLAGLTGRVSALETNQGGTTLSAHRSALVLDHPNESVTADKLASNSVTTSKIADNAVTGAKIADGAITSAKIADNAIVGLKIADNSISATKIADGAVTGTKIADNAISRTKILNGEVTADKLAPVRDAPLITPSPGDWLLGGLASGTGVGKLPLGQANGVPLLNAIGALASADAYLDRGALNSAVDWNTITTAGVYQVSSGAFGTGSANTPPATYQYGVLLVLVGGTTIQQIFIPQETDWAIYFRQAHDAPPSWSQWFAAGATYGSNSNGSYIRFADGTQICWAKQSTAQWGAVGEGSVVRGVVTVYAKDLGITFPAAFSSEPSIVVGGDIVGTGGTQLKSLAVWGSSASGFNIGASYQASGSDIFSYYIAIGRWK